MLHSVFLHILKDSKPYSDNVNEMPIVPFCQVQWNFNRDETNC